MKKEHLKGFVAGILLMAMLSATLVFASSGITREIHYGISVVLNGQAVQFDEDSRPFVMDNRTFLPLRAMAELLGLPIEFDFGTNTAYLGHTTPKGFLIGGFWEIEYDEYDTSVERIEFFEDGTGKASMFRLCDATVLDTEHFIWSVEGYVLTLFFALGDSFESIFSIYRNVFDGTEMLVLSGLDDNWLEVLIRGYNSSNMKGLIAADLPYTFFDSEGNRFYIVQPGHTFWSIAMRIYGDGEHFADILAANDISETDSITVGMTLIIPD